MEVVSFCVVTQNGVAGWSARVAGWSARVAGLSRRTGVPGLGRRTGVPGLAGPGLVAGQCG